MGDKSQLPALSLSAFLIGLTVEPVQDLLLVLLQPVDVSSGPLQGLLHSQRGGAKPCRAVLLHKLLQLPEEAWGNCSDSSLTFRVQPRKTSWAQTCCSSAGVENLAVTPLIREAKEKEPTPYLKKTHQPSLNKNWSWVCHAIRKFVQR